MYKENRIEYNIEREKLGIPIIPNDWKIDEFRSEQFVTYWHKPETKNGHFKKEIEYGILKIKFETDFYKKEKTVLWSSYNFDKNKFEYFLEKPNENEISITEKGKVKYEKPTVIVEINKSEFEKYIVE